MDVGGATHWSPARVVSRDGDARRRSRAHYGADRRRSSSRSSAPADRFALPDGTIFGIISSTTEPFCRTCDRSRLTADGMWYLCLYATARHRSARAAARGASRRGTAAVDCRRLAARATIAAPKSGSRSATGARSCRFRIYRSRTRTSKCTLAAGSPLRPL